MSKIEDRRELMLAAWQRVSAIEFGEPVTNICAGDGNPRQHAYFVTIKTSAKKNRHGVVHRERWARCTDGKGRFWDTSIEVVYPGHLPIDEAHRLFKPIHAILY